MSLNAANYLNLIYLTSGTSFVVPATWNKLNNFIACIGGANAGGGAYAQSNNISLIPYQSYQIQIGSNSNSNDTWFGGSSLAGSIVGANGDTTGNGGQASLSIGQIVFSGGPLAIGGNGQLYMGGGAGGPNGAGAGGSFPIGGNADGGTVAGGAANTYGNSGNEFGKGFGCGSGGGAGVPSNGGNYGGGAGGGSGQGLGTPGGGLIVLGFSPLNGPALLIGI
jgi:hypothetical protein